MKNHFKKLTPIFFLLSIMISIWSCEKDSTIDDLSVSNLLSDSDLIQQIKDSDLRVIDFTSLPESSKSTIVSNYVSNGDSPNTSFKSPSLGYMVNLVGQGRKVDVFFNTEGRELNGEDEGEEYTDSCWVYTFPITYVMSDGTQILIENENDYTQVENWYSSNPNLEPGFSFVFPITIQYGEGQSTTIGSEEELGVWEENNCNSGDGGEDEGDGEGEDEGEDEDDGEDDGEDEGDGEGEDEGEDEDDGEDDGEDEGEEYTDSCWVYTYPITYVMSDGTQILIESENDYTQVENWYSSNPNLEPGFSFVFPITIQYGEGQSTTIGSEEELGVWEENNCNSGDGSEDEEGDVDNG